MQFSMRNRIDQLGQKARRQEGKVLRAAGEVLAGAIADNIRRSGINSATYKHLADNIETSRTKTSQIGERYVQVGAIKELGYRLKFLELGTSKMSAQMPISIGVSEAKNEVAQTLAEGMKRILKS